MSRCARILSGLVLVSAGLVFAAWMVAPEKNVRAVGEAIDSLIGTSAAQAEANTPKFSPVKALKEHEADYPGTEDIAPDEMRITACGTGMPSAPETGCRLLPC